MSNAETACDDDAHRPSCPTCCLPMWLFGVKKLERKNAPAAEERHYKCTVCGEARTVVANA